MASVAREAGAGLIFGSDAHGPSQMPTLEFARNVCRGAGLADEEIDAMFEHAARFAKHKAVQKDLDENDDW